MAHRILILTNRTPYPFKDGGNLAMRAMIEGYHSAGWEVYLLAMNTRRHPVPDAELKTAYSHIQYVETVPVDNEIKILPTIGNYLFSSQPNHAVRFFHPEFATKLADVLQTFKPGVVQLESLYLATYLPVIKANASAFTILRLHNIEHQVWERLSIETANPFKKFYLKDLSKRIRRFEHDTWEQFDLLLPITKEDANAVNEVVPGASMIVVPFAVDSNNILINKDTHWNAYHIGAMDWLPNAEAVKWFLEDIWPSVYQSHPDFKFYFAGRNMPAAFQQNLPAGVVCAGEVADAAQFITDKKILIVPLRSGGGMRIKILEAMVTGKIVISTAIGMQGISAIPNTHFLEANTTDEFKEKINWVLDNKALAESIAKNGVDFVRSEYSNEHIMQGFISKIESRLK